MAKRLHELCRSLECVSASIVCPDHAVVDLDIEELLHKRRSASTVWPHPDRGQTHGGSKPNQGAPCKQACP